MAYNNKKVPEERLKPTKILQNTNTRMYHCKTEEDKKTKKINPQEDINYLVTDIKQMLGKLIPLIEQRKIDLEKKTNENHSYSKLKSRSYLASKISSSKSEQNSMKLLAKFRNDDIKFDLDHSENSDEETEANNIFNNNMSYLNSSDHIANPGYLKNKSQNPNFYSLPINETNYTVNYSNKSAEPAFFYGGSSSNVSNSKRSFQTKFSNERNAFQKDSRNPNQNQGKKIFENKDSYNNNNNLNPENYYCCKCKNYIHKTQFFAHQQKCSKR